MPDEQNHYIDTDADGIRYLIPLDKEEDWDAWRHLDQDSPNGIATPEYAQMIGDGALVEFEENH